VIADAITDQRLGNIALTYDDGTGDVSYRIAAEARGRGAATGPPDQRPDMADRRLRAPTTSSGRVTIAPQGAVILASGFAAIRSFR
jgi:hypothetical protein